MQKRRQLNIRNTHATNYIYILENASQTTTESIQIRPGEERFYEMSTTGTDNTTGPDLRPPDTISKSLFVAPAGNTTMTVEEAG